MAKGEIVQPRELVKADNAFFRVRCKVKNILATRIVMAFASLVDESDINENKRFLKYKIDASSIIKNIDAGGNYYNQIREAAYTLVDQKIEQRKHKNHFKVYTLFSTIEYENGIITGEFHADLLQFFLGLKKQFTRISLSQYLKLPSIYSQKLFSYLTSWAGTPEVTLSVSDLHVFLDTPESFRKNFAEFRRRVLDKAHKDITELTSLRYDWEPVKVGRSVEKIRFTFRKKPLLQDRTKPLGKLKTALCDSMTSETPKGQGSMEIARPCFQAHGGICSEDKQEKAVCDFCRAVLQKKPHIFLRLSEQGKLV